MDYSGDMCVPVTFLDKHNPEQFEIVGSSRLLGMLKAPWIYPEVKPFTRAELSAA